MNKLKRFLVELARNEEGLTTVEYAVAGSIVTAGLIVAFGGLGNTVTAAINAIAAFFS